MIPIRPLVIRLFAVSALLASSVATGDAPTLKTTELGRGPVVVFVHSLGSSRSAWMPTARRLIGRHRVVLVDLPGHGDSPLGESFSLQNAAEALDGVLQKQNPDSTIVVGHALGGLIALMQAGAHPERSRGLFMIDAQLKTPIPVPDQQKKYLLEYIDANYDAFAKAMFTQLGRDSAQGVTIHALAMQTQPATVKAYIRELLNVDANGALKATKRPVRLLLTSRAWKGTRMWGDVAKDLGWDDSTAVKPQRMEDAGYLVMSDQPDSLAARIAAFASEVIGSK